MAPKACPTCHRTEPEIAFARDRYKPDGRTRECTTCRKARFSRWYEKNGDEWRAHSRDYQRRIRFGTRTEKERDSVCTIRCGPAGFRVTWTEEGWLVETLRIGQDGQEQLVRRRTTREPLDALLSWCVHSAVYRRGAEE